MAAINFTKISGVIRVAQDGGAPKSYFTPSRSVEPSPSGTEVTVYLGGASFTVKLTDLRVNGQTPVNMNDAISLLNAILAT